MHAYFRPTQNATQAPTKDEMQQHGIKVHNCSTRSALLSERNGLASTLDQPRPILTATFPRMPNNAQPRPETENVGTAWRTIQPFLVSAHAAGWLRRDIDPLTRVLRILPVQKPTPCERTSFSDARFC
jgi:hypothetical protein